MLGVSYYQKVLGLPVEKNRLLLLKATDVSILVREMSKMSMIAGAVVSLSSVFFSFHDVSTGALTLTVVSGVSWLLTTACANKLEPQAQEIIRLLSKEE